MKRRTVAGCHCPRPDDVDTPASLRRRAITHDPHPSAVNATIIGRASSGGCVTANDPSSSAKRSCSTGHHRTEHPRARPAIGRRIVSFTHGSPWQSGQTRGQNPRSIMPNPPHREHGSRSRHHPRMAAICSAPSRSSQESNGGPTASLMADPATELVDRLVLIPSFAAAATGRGVEVDGDRFARLVVAIERRFVSHRRCRPAPNASRHTDRRSSRDSHARSRTRGTVRSQGDGARPCRADAGNRTAVRQPRSAFDSAARHSHGSWGSALGRGWYAWQTPHSVQ